MFKYSFFCLQPSFQRKIMCQNAIALVKTLGDLYKGKLPNLVSDLTSHPRLSNVSFLDLGSISSIIRRRHYIKPKLLTKK